MLLKKVYKGSNQICKVYKGSSLLYANICQSINAPINIGILEEELSVLNAPINIGILEESVGIITFPWNYNLFEIIN